jgi:VanZ family protein
VIISTVLFLLPGAAIPKAGILDTAGIDKFVHVVLFFIMVVLWCLALRQKRDTSERKKLFIKIGTAALVYGISIELIQHFFIPHRSFDLIDLIADAAGSALGLVFCMSRYIKK